MTPVLRCAGVRLVMADVPPRNLNDPVCCRHSALMSTRRPVSLLSRALSRSGVVAVWPLSLFWALIISLKLIASFNWWIQSFCLDTIVQHSAALVDVQVISPNYLRVYYDYSKL